MVSSRAATVIFLLPVFPVKPGTGGEIYNRQVIDRLIAGGFQVRVVTLDSLVGLDKLHQPSAIGEVRQKLAEWFETQGMQVAETGAPTTLVYDSWLYRYLWPLLLFERLRGRFRLISFSQLCYWDTYNSWRARAWHRLQTLLALVPAHRRVGVSASLLDADLGIFRSRRRDLVVYPGCDYILQQLEQADCARMPAQIVSVGNYTPRKGFHVLIEALAGVFSQQPSLRGSLQLKLVGNRSFNPDYVKKLESMTAAHGLESAVVLEDWQTRAQISRLFSEAQLFAFASESEGFGMVVMEAMLHGLPVLLGDFMTARELVGDSEECGFVVSRHSSAAFTQAILRFFSHADRRQMGLNARNRALQTAQDWDAVAGKFAGLFSREKFSSKASGGK